LRSEALRILPLSRRLSLKAHIMHFLLGGPSEPGTTPTLVAEPSVVNTEALAMPCNAVPPSSLAALGEEGCRHSALQEDAVTSTLLPFGVAADSNAEPCPAASHPVSAVDDQRPEGSQFSRRAARSEWNHPSDDVAATELASWRRTCVSKLEYPSRSFPLLGCAWE